MQRQPTQQAPGAGGAPNFKIISGVLERITYQSEENGYTVARFLPDRMGKRETKSSSPQARAVAEASPRYSATKGDDNLVTVVGNMVGVAPGEVLELTGWWQHSQHGWQFKVENYRSVLPATEQGIRKYLGSGLIKGIGLKTTEKIVGFLGLETLEVLENQPQRLNEVPKLGPHKAGLIAKAWVEQKAIKEVMVFLQGHGVSTSLAVKIYKEYKDAAITIVKNEPYRLAREIWGIGFKTADKIAQSLGLGLDHPERIKAGTLFVLSEASDSGGHTYLPRPKLAEKAAELLGVSSELVDAGITGLVLDGGAQVETITKDPKDGRMSFIPLVAGTSGNASPMQGGKVTGNSASTNSNKPEVQNQRDLKAAGASAGSVLKSLKTGANQTNSNSNSTSIQSDNEEEFVESLSGQGLVRAWKSLSVLPRFSRLYRESRRFIYHPSTLRSKASPGIY